MPHPDPFLPRQIRDRPCHLEQPMVRAGAETELNRRPAEQITSFLVEGTELLEFPRSHMRAAVHPPAREPALLAGARFNDPRADGRRVRRRYRA